MAEEPISVYTLIAVSLDQFAAIAFQKMGLQPDPLTNEICKDLKQAKLAIDIAARFAEVLETELDDSDKRRVQSLISDLRINFVKQSA